jgi:hypothetical protein
MGGVTLPSMARRLDKPRSVLERIVWSYRDRLPAPEKIGNARVWPLETIERVRQILLEEARCAGGRIQ